MADFTKSEEFKKTQAAIKGAQELINATDPLTQDQLEKYKADGFLLPAAYSGDGNGLPYTKVKPNQDARLTRKTITWFIPEFGTVRMYVNPNSIRYNFKKLINTTLTKGGYTLQYWGEELPTLTISGTTGSAGVEGINTLYEIYRAEQYAFDTTGLVISANNAAQNLATDGFNAIGNAISSKVGGLGGSLLGTGLFGGNATNGSGGTVQTAGLLGSVLGLNSPTSSLMGTSYTTLAQLAFTVEMYHDGWVYRGFFESFDFNEKSDNFLWDYNLTFKVTQRRGYRTNYFPWHKNPAQGPSRYDTPNSFSGYIPPE